MRFIYCFLLSVTSVTLNAQALTVSNLRCEYATAPAGIVTKHPGLSWQLNSNQQDVMQTAYRIVVADDPSLLVKDEGNVWDSKKTESDSSLQIVFKGKQLLPAHVYYWKVKAWDNHGNESAWSNIAQWQTGLFTNQDWKNAQWISNQQLPVQLRTILNTDTVKDQQQGANILPLLRKQFNINKQIKRATIFISGLGQFELTINGKKIGDHILDPGWTQYSKEAQYVCFDVTANILQGNNAIGVMLGNGFYYIPPVKKRYRKLKATFGYPKMICRLVIEYNDGTENNIISDASWKTAESPIIYSGVYGGEDHDARKEQPGWGNANFDDAAWAKAIVVDGPASLTPQLQAPVKVMDHFPAKTITRFNDSIYVYDFGQNASAIISISLKGKKGDTVRIIPGELLNANGLPNQNATGKPFYYTYILKSDSIETWRPRFTYYGFRYAAIEGAVQANKNNPFHLPEIIDLVSLHIRNSASTIGHFESSFDLFNRTDTLINWAIKSNMMSVFTDCPHREKLGWLEQAHLMGNSVQYNYDVATLYRKLVNDMMQAQTVNGLVPEIAPELVQFTYGNDMFRNSPEWGSSCIIVPWYMYQWYGDKQTLQAAYGMMKKYISYLQSVAKDNIITQGLGDWYDLGPKPPGVSQLTQMGVTATAIYYYDLVIIAKIADLLQTGDGQSYRALAASVKQSFNNKFFDPQTKQYATGSQTANALAVYMQLVPEAYQQDVIDNIVKDVRQHNNSLTAGDIGYRYLLKVLDEAGRSDVIFDMNSRSDVPGYGYQLAKGATALTESWQGLENSSNNHFMLGHLMEWFYNGLAGISQDSNSIAYKHVLIRPQVVGNIDSATASFQSPYGLIKSSWKKTGNSFSLQVVIPANTKATVQLPNKNHSLIKMNGAVVDKDKIKQVIDISVTSVGSGEYDFEIINE